MCYGWYDEAWQIERAKRAQRLTEERKQQTEVPAAAREPEPETEAGKHTETQPEAIPA
jgi:hypothetical protein